MGICLEPHAFVAGLARVPRGIDHGGRDAPVPEPERTRPRAIRRGEVERDEVLAAVADAEAQLMQLGEHSPPPDQPDRARVDDWLHRSHLEHWVRLQRPRP